MGISAPSSIGNKLKKLKKGKSKRRKANDGRKIV